jgi:phosphomannomutase
MTITFGTDGWRAVVGRDFTTDNVATVIQAFADLYPTLPEAGRPVMVGFDRRNQSPETAKFVSRILAANQIPTFLADDYCPTPMVSWNVVKHEAACGIMVTASHNPPEWNGIKFKEAYGGAASPAYTDPIEAQIATNVAAGRVPCTTPAADAPAVQSFGMQSYLEQLRELVNIQAINGAGLRVLYDPMYGSGAKYLSQMIRGVTEIHGHRDVTFGGIHPEPIIPYVNEAITTMQGGGYDVCVITDGDADRIGAVDEQGTYMTSHEIFALLLLHTLETRKWRGNVVKSITTTQMIDRIAREFGMDLTVTPVGFKHISPTLNVPNMLAGGEESGGIGFPRHVCERDGLMCALLLVEMMALRKTSMSGLVTELQERFGPCKYRRIDLKLTETEMATARTALQGDLPQELCGQSVKHLNRIDGHHFLREDDSWLLVRASGTEPLFRTYAEARTQQEVDDLLAAARPLLGLTEK